MIMVLDYNFTLDAKEYEGIGVEIGETIDLESEAKKIDELKIDAICHALNCEIEEAEELVSKCIFKECELRI